MERKASAKTSKKNSPQKDKKSKKDFLVVGLGASAGGVRALQEFFATMPPDSGMAFVAILHLSPEHESRLAEILQAQTAMKVTQVNKTVKVEPNNVYVIPPNQQLEMVDGVIRPKEAERTLGHRVAIDVFFRTLAEAYEKNAVCVVLSGTGSDGTLGLKRVKESNGFAIVQLPEDAEYDSMPRSAINTRLADWVLPVNQMPEKIAEYQDILQKPSAENQFAAFEAEQNHAGESLREILKLLQIQTGTTQRLEEELRETKKHLAAVIEKHHATVNELQSVNEKLTAVNHELQEKIDDPNRVNSDLQNLMAATDIATIFLDKNLKIKRYTPPVEEIFNVTPVDIGRPLEHFTHRLSYQNLAADAGRVLRTLKPVERQTEDAHGNTFLARFAPYRTVDDRIDGVVLNFIDITEIQRSENALQKSEERYRDLFDSIDEGFCTIEVLFDENEKAVDYRFLACNPSFERQTGIENAVGRTMRELVPRHEEHWFQIYGQVALTGESVRFQNFAGQLEKFYDVYAFRVGAPAERKVGILFNDISERRQAEHALRESEERLRLATEAAGAYSWEYDVESGSYKFSPNAAKVLGIAKKNLPRTVEDTFALVHPDDKQLIEKTLKTAVRTGTGFALDFRTVTSRGKIVWLAVQSTVVKDESGKPARIIGIAQNITERKEIEENLRVSEERIRIAVEAGELGTWEWDIPNDRVYWNERHFTLFGMKPSKRPLKPEDFFYHIYIEDRDWVSERLNTAVKKKIPFEAEFRADIERDGVRWMQGYGRVIETGKNGKATRMSGVMLDITDRKRTDEALRKSEEHLHLILESTKDYAIITFDLARDITRWNTGAEKMFGYTEKEIVGRDGTILFTPEDRAANVPEKEFQTALKKGRAEDERYHLRKDGSRFYVSGVMQPLKDGKTEGFVKIARDMTEHLEAENIVREKETLRRLVVGQEDERRRIARDLHDHLGQQISALRLKLDTVKAMCDEQAICDEITEAEKIVGHLDADVDFLAWELRPVALDDLGLRVALENFTREWAHHTKIKAEFHAARLGANRLDYEIETNLYRIAQEALNNIYKHAKAKTVSVLLEKRKNTLVLIVEDDGIGFDPDDKRTKNKGIGLIGMQERAAILGGALEIESRKGKGTTVFVRVPLAFGGKKE